MSDVPALAFVNRIAGVLELTSSPFDGEALTAARTAHAMLAKRNLTWRDFLAPLAGGPPEPGRRDFTDPSHMVRACLANPARLTAWELGFLESIERILARGRDLSEKQAAVLARLYRKART